MFTSTRFKITSSAVCAALLFGSTAPVAAQPKDLSPDQVAAALQYGLPLAFAAYRSTCADQIAPGGYVEVNADRLEAKFQEASQVAWPNAKAMMQDMATKDDPSMASVFEMLPDDALRPFVDGILQGMVAAEIKHENCGDIERGLELLDPMPVENIAGLVGFVLEIDQRNKAKKADANEQVMTAE